MVGHFRDGVLGQTSPRILPPYTMAGQTDDLVPEMPCRIVFSRSHPLSAASLLFFTRFKDVLQRKYSESSKVSP